MNSRIFLIIPVISLVFLCSPVSSGECPPGASDCFLCGGVDGIPCTKNCVGEWDPVMNDYVCCRCPQGEPCVCYCPYIATTTPTRIPAKTSVRIPLVAKISMHQYDPYAPSMVDFSDESTGPVSYRHWDFGDDQRTSMLVSPTIIYSEPGRYIVTLTIVDDEGNKDTDSVTIRVLPVPITELDDSKTETSSIPLSTGIIPGAVFLAALLVSRKISG